MSNVNMARNGQFNLGLIGWDSSGVVIDSNHGRTTSKCAKFTFTTTNSGNLRQLIPIEPSNTYTVTCYIKHYGCTNLSIGHYGANGWEYIFIPVSTDGSNGYQKYEATFDSSENSRAIGMDISLWIYSDPNRDDAYAYVDDISVEGVAPTRWGLFTTHNSCNVYSKATGNRLDSCPPNRKLFAHYQDGDTIILNWPSKRKPLATITLNDENITGYVAPNFQSSATGRILQVVTSEVGRTLSEFGNVADPWCQTFVNWISILGGIDPEDPVYDISGCNSAIRSLGDRYHAVGDTVEPGDYVPSGGDWVYYCDTSDAVDPNSPAAHVGYIVSANSTSLETIEANRGADIVQRFTVPIRGAANGSSLKVIGFARPPYKD